MEKNSREPMTTSKASWVKIKNPNANSNKNEQGSHWGLLPYDNNQWECVLDETSTSIVKFFLKPQGPLLYIYLYFKKEKRKEKAFLNVHTGEIPISLSYVYCVCYCLKYYPFLHSHLFICGMKSPPPRWTTHTRSI